MSELSVIQSKVIQILTDYTDWGKLDDEILQKFIKRPKKAGARFTAFLKNGGKSITRKQKIICNNNSLWKWRQRLSSLRFPSHR